MNAPQPIATVDALASVDIATQRYSWRVVVAHGLVRLEGQAFIEAGQLLTDTALAVALKPADAMAIGRLMFHTARQLVEAQQAQQRAAA